MSLVRPNAAIALLSAAVALAGCGSSGGGRGSEETGSQTTQQAPAGATAQKCSSTLRVTGVDCATGEAVVEEWEGEPNCQPQAEASRLSCSLGSYRCLGTATDRGLAVFCAQRGRSIVFVPKPD